MPRTQHECSRDRAGCVNRLDLQKKFLMTWLPDQRDKEVVSKSVSLFLMIGIVSLDDQLDASEVGNKAEYFIPAEAVGLPQCRWAGCAHSDDPEPLIKFLQHSDFAPLVVRSSAEGPRSKQRQLGGTETILPVHTSSALQQAIARVRLLTTALMLCNTGASWPSRRHYGGADSKTSQGRIFSGVAFSRDRINQQDNAV